MTMQPRSFRAPHMMAALEDIQRELGPEALVVSVREVNDGPAWQVWRKAGVEVMAMAPQTGDMKKPEPIPFPTAPVPPAAQKAREPEAKAARPEKALPSALQKELRQLQAQELDPTLLARVARSCAQGLSPASLRDPVRVRRHLQLQLRAELRTLRPTQFAVHGVACLVGPSGSGKTSTIAKLAAHYTLTLKQKVAWVSADTVRTGAIALARAYTEGLGLGLQLAYTPEELGEIVGDAEADLILIDLPSCNPRREAGLLEMGELLAALPRRDVYLTAPATAKYADLRQMLASFGPFDLKGLVITKLDESVTLGNVINMAWRSRLPLAYFTSGTGVLEDLEPADPEQLVARLWRP